MAKAFLALFPYVLVASAISTANLVRLGPQGINQWKLNKAAAASSAAQSKIRARDIDFPQYNFTQPLDHFVDTGFTFSQRYWVNTRHYTPGTHAPVIVLDTGEDTGEDRLPYLDTGIVDILANATGGIGIVLEHRYYGDSVPVQNLSTDSLRWLNNSQALEDSANFIRNVQIPGISENVTAPNTPWIYYGGSYAGARSAHMKVLYPDIVYGAIASSGVVHAALSNWQYMEVIRRAADQNCSENLQNGIVVVDGILEHKTHTAALKALFGLPNVTHDQDFVSVLSDPLGYWQDKNWDPAVGDTLFDDFCNAINTPPKGSTSDILALSYASSKRLVNTPVGLKVDFSLANYANYINVNFSQTCTGESQDDCFGTFNASAYQETGLDQTWRLWQFQVCVQWGYFTTAPPNPTYPRIISNLTTLPYLSKICQQAYPPGEHFQVPSLPNVTSVNVLGDFAIAADRLAIVDGQDDPWRPDTAHSWYAKNRTDTITRPFKLIPGAVHHWDENGLANHSLEPPEIQAIHSEEVQFVLDWLKDWKAPSANTTS